MLVAIDVGNTELHFGIFVGDRLKATWRLSSAPRRTADEYLLLMEAALKRAGFEPDGTTEAIVATVAPQKLPAVLTACAQLFRAEPLVVGPGVKTRLKIRFDPPTELGGDRVANAVAAHQLHGPGPVIVVDFGTATAFDIVSGGEYLGGALTPGLQISAEALASRTSRIPRVDLTAPASAIGRNTSHALQAGLVLGHVSLLEGMIQRIRQEIGPAQTVATGDDSSFFARLTNAIDVVDPHLTLHGLRMIHSFNG